MSAHNIIFMMIGNILKISLNICFLELSEKMSLGLKNEFELATVNESSVI